MRRRDVWGRDLADDSYCWRSDYPVTPAANQDSRMLPAPRLELPVPVGMCGKEDLNVFLGIGMEDHCPVCGDHVSGYHYGLQTCESCKGFFKRTVQNKKVYTCADSSSCIINKAQRKNCPYCRFRKCLDVGMKIEAVRENRVRGGRNKFGPMYKYHRALKLQAERYRQQVLMQIGTAFLQSPYSSDIVRRFCSPEQKMDVEPSVSRLNAPQQQQQTWPPGSFINDQAQGRMVQSDLHIGRQQRYDSFSRIEFDRMPPKDLRRLSEDFDVQRRQTMSSQKPMPDLEPLHPVPHQRTMTVRHDYPALQKAVPQSLEAYRNRSHSFPNLETFVEDVVGSEQRGPPSLDSLTHSSLEDIDGLTIPKVDTDDVEYCMGSGSSAVCSDLTRFESATPSSVRIPIAELMGTTADYEVIRTKFRAVSEVILQDFKDAFIGRYDQPVLAAGSQAAEELRPLLVQLVCRLCDQALFLMVEWVRSASLFKQLKVEDQIKLIENCWSEILVIDLLYLQTRHDRSSHLLMMSGHMVPVDLLELVGFSDLTEKLLDLITKMKSLDLHLDELTCLKFLVLLNPDVGGLCDQSVVEKSQEKVSNALMDYCSSVNCNRFGQLLMQLPEIQVLSLQVEDYLQRQCLLGRVPSKSILAEMLMSSSHR